MNRREMRRVGPPTVKEIKGVMARRGFRPCGKECTGHGRLLEAALCRAGQEMTGADRGALWKLWPNNFKRALKGASRK